MDVNFLLQVLFLILFDFSEDSLFLVVEFLVEEGQGQTPIIGERAHSVNRISSIDYWKSYYRKVNRRLSPLSFRAL